MRTLLPLALSALCFLPACGRDEAPKTPPPSPGPAATAPARPSAPAPDAAARAAALLADFQKALAANQLLDADAILKQLEALQPALPPDAAAQVTAARAALDAARQPVAPLVPPPPGAPAVPLVPVPATVPASAAAGDVQQQALSLLDQIKQNMLDKRWELGEGAFKQLDGIKGQLPAALQQKIAEARTAFDVAKRAADGLPFK